MHSECMKFLLCNDADPLNKNITNISLVLLDFKGVTNVSHFNWIMLNIFLSKLYCLGLSPFMYVLEKNDFVRCSVSYWNWFVLIFNSITYSSQLQEKANLQHVWEVNVKYLKVKPRQRSRQNLSYSEAENLVLSNLMYNNYHLVWLLKEKLFLTFKCFCSKHSSDILAVVVC